MKLTKNVSIRTIAALGYLDKTNKSILEEPVFFYQFAGEKNPEIINFEAWKVILKAIPVLRMLARVSDIDLDQLEIIGAYLNYCEGLVKELNKSKV